VGGRDPSAAATSRTEKATDCRYKDYDSNPAISLFQKEKKRKRGGREAHCVAYDDRPEAWCTTVGMEGTAQVLDQYHDDAFAGVFVSLFVYLSHTHTHTHIHACMHACMHTYIQTHMHACMHIRAYIRIYIHTSQIGFIEMDMVSPIYI
jgi:hypothetical protein